MSEKPQWLESRILDPESVQTILPEVDIPQPITPLEIDSQQLLLSAEKEVQPTTSPPSVNRWARRFGKGLLVLLALSSGIGLGQLVVWGYDIHTALGGAIAGLVAFLLSSGAFALWREIRGVRQLDQLKKLRESARLASSNENHGRAAAMLGDICDFYDKHPIADEFSAQRHILDPRYSNAEYLQLLSRRTLQPIDKDLYQLVTRRSLESAVLVGISPMISLDMLLMLWRNSRMLNEIARYYGLQTSLSSRIYLFKQVMHNLAFVGVSEAVIGTGNELLGASVMGVLSARAGQGVAAGVLTARLGLQAIELCRPLPFVEGEKPSLSEIRRQLVSQSRQLFREYDSATQSTAPDGSGNTKGKSVD